MRAQLSIFIRGTGGFHVSGRAGMYLLSLRSKGKKLNAVCQEQRQLRFELAFLGVS